MPSPARATPYICLYPTDFLPCIAAATGFELGPNQSTIVKARWPKDLVPSAGTHACWLAAVLTRFDHPVSGRHVWEHNNLAQKNLTIVNLSPGDWFILPFVVKNLSLRLTSMYHLELRRPKNMLKLNAMLLHRQGTVFKSKDQLFRMGGIYDEKAKRLDCGTGFRRKVIKDADQIFTSRTQDTLTAKQFEKARKTIFKAGRISRVPIVLARREQVLMGLRLQITKRVRKDTIIKLDLVQREAKSKRILGGISIEIHVI